MYAFFFKLIDYFALTVKGALLLYIIVGVIFTPFFVNFLKYPSITRFVLIF